jgi:hypothetical protein
VSRDPIASSAVMVPANRNQPQQLDRIVDHDSGATEIVGKPYDVDLSVNHVEAAMKRVTESAPRAAEAPRRRT